MALYFIHQSAEDGNADAMTLYGKLHLVEDNSSGYTGNWNPSHALQWFQKAIVIGNPGALYYAGNIHEEGNGVKADLDLAIKMYRQSSKLGYKPATDKMQELEMLGIV